MSAVRSIGPTAAAPPARAAAGQRSSFVAVSGDAAETTAAPRADRSDGDGRLQAEALCAARAEAAVLCAGFAIALVGDVVLLAPSPWRGVWAVCALLTLAAWTTALVRGPGRGGPLRAARRQRAFVPLALALAAMVVLALAPWLPGPPASPAERPVLAFTLGVLLAGAAVGVALGCRRRWLRGARAVLAHEDRLRELEAARDAAIRSDQEKSRFLAIASHDLRQPMHALGLFAATLERRLRGSGEELLVHNLVRSIDGLDRSFNVMLDVSRLDAGTIEPNFQRFPLRDLFRRLHMYFGGQAEQAGLGLRFAPGGKWVTSDPQLLERLLGNLIQNAIKYTERGGVVVVARTTEAGVNVEVWDTGMGIPASELPRIFGEFYQVGRGERARERGFGMGLAIVKRLALLLGHRLEVSSQPGRGTMFRIGIAAGGLPESEDVTAAADTLPMPLPVAQPRTVLIVDDEEPIRRGLVLLLEEWGYQALAAGTVEQAVRLVRRLDGPPDLILSDLHLGDGSDGLAAIDAVRRECGLDVTAILITGDTSHGELRRATDSGHPVLFKPVQPRKLLDALRGYMP